MIQEAVVTGVYEDGTADVAVERAAMCGGDCSKCEACMYENVIKTRAKNPISAPPGARVHIETDSNQVFLATLAIYALPMLVFFIGYGLGALLGFSQDIKILFAFVFLGLGAGISAIILKVRQKKEPMPAVITEIVPRDSPRNDFSIF